MCFLIQKETKEENWEGTEPDKDKKLISPKVSWLIVLPLDSYIYIYIFLFS